jgi:hypothetical protein
MNIPTTHNLEYGFFGTIARAGLNAQSYWATAIAVISEMTNHTHLGDIAIYLDSKTGHWFAEYILHDEETAYAPIKYSISKQVQRTSDLKRALQEIAQERTC